MRFRFGRYELDEEAGELRCDGVSVAIQPKPFALLCLLIRERERVVPADELFEALWPGVAVTPSSLTRAVSTARRAIGDGHRGETLRSVPRRGYRFTADVSVVAGARAGAGPRPAERASTATESADARPFVGRAAVLDQLWSLWTRASQGRGALALVSGPPGIGKTRLVERLVGDVEAAGGLALVGRAHDAEGVPAFWLWAQVLRALAERGPDPEALRELSGAPAEVAELVPGLAGADPGPAAVSLAPEQRRFLFFDAVARALARSSRRRPLLIALEDLQWAGPASLRLLEHVGYHASEAALLLLATVRDESRPEDHPLELMLPSLRRQGACSEIALRGFSRREVAELLELRMGRQPPADLTSELFARTEGVPLFLLEAIRLLAERGDLRHPERIRHWAVSLPAHALDLIRRPLERLPEPCTRVVEAAAVLGREFPVSLLAAVAELPRDRVLDLLDEAARAGVVESSPHDPATWRFPHALFREAAHDGTAPGRCARLHLRAAEEIERRHVGDLDRVAAEVAHHRHESLAVGDPARAFAWAVRAAERASRLLAHEQATVHHAQALAALDHEDPVDPVRRLGTLLALGEAHRLARDRGRARNVFGEAMEVAGALELPRERALAAIGFCDLSEWAPPDPEANQRVEAALAGLPDACQAERVRLLTRLAYLSMRERPERSEPLAREAIELARRLGDAQALQDALYALFFRLAGPDHVEERQALGQETLASAQKRGATDTALISMLDMVCHHIMLGEAAEARRWREHCGALAGDEPHPGRQWHLRVFDAGFALLLGRHDEARRLAQEATALGQRIAHPYARGVARSLAVDLARDRGDAEEVLRIFPPTRPVRLGPRQWVQAIIARSLVELGRRDEAWLHYRELVEGGPEQVPRNIRWHSTVSELAHLCADLGDAGGAAALIELLQPVAHHHGVLPMPIHYSGPFTRALARLEETRGNLAQADELFEEAFEACAALSARPMQARLLAERGALCLRRGKQGAGRELLAQGEALALELGMQGVARAARAPLGRSQAS